jgi:hypothetical protein
VAEALQVILQDDSAAALEPPDEEAYAIAPGRGQGWGKRNERPIGY